MKNKTVKITLRRLPDGSVINNEIVNVAYQIDKISGGIVVYAADKVLRVGDRVSEKTVEKMPNNYQEITTVKGDHQ
jgi:hypothetical protein